MRNLRLFAQLSLFVALVTSTPSVRAGGGGGGGDKGGGGKGGGDKGGGGGGKGGDGKGGGGGWGNHDPNALILPKHFIISVKDRSSGSSEVLLECKKPARVNYEKKVTIASGLNPSYKVNYGCDRYRPSISLRNYEGAHE